MAAKSTIYKVKLNIADMDREYYADHSLTLACHPSETEERLIVRIVAFALFASEDMQFTRGLSSDDEPDIWRRDLTGDVLHWIELGMPDESRIRKGCNRSKQVTVVTYGDRAPPIWWEKIHNNLTRFDNLSVLHLSSETTDALTTLINRGMDLQVSIQDGIAWVSNGGTQIEVRPAKWR